MSPNENCGRWPRIYQPSQKAYSFSYFMIRLSKFLLLSILFLPCIIETQEYPQVMTIQPTPSRTFEVVRFKNNPIIYPDMPGLRGEIGKNIDGPSLIKVPDWVKKPLGKYYLYFAHHRGNYIRFGYANTIDGPWTIYEPGVLNLKDAPGRDHVAGPDVHVDNERKEIRMYFHQLPPKDSQSNDQVTYVAISKDGLSFEAREEILGKPYFRLFKYNGYYYAFAKNYRLDGVICRSKDGLTKFEEGPHFFPNIRHTATWIQNSKLYLFFTLIGDCPERILLSTIDLNKDWKEWQSSAPEIVLEPETEYEGANLPLEASKESLSLEPVRQLRDPAVFEESGKLYLLYSIAGESGIAMARLRDKK